MRFAAIADIHGNSAALTEVLADMDRLGIDRAVNLGDHFSGPLDAAGAAEILMERDFPSIRGNHDRWLIEQDRNDMGPSDRVACDLLSETQLDWLRALTPTLLFEDTVFLCHGTPDCDTRYWLEEVSPDGTVRPASLQSVEQHAAGIDASLILCGHTHVPRVISLSDGRLVVNPGSVGCPAHADDVPVPHVMQTGTPDACYAILEFADGCWSTTIRHVPYDHTAMVARARQNNRPEWARALATGWLE